MTAEQKERVLVIDAEVQLSQLTTRVVEEIDSLEPYGIGNPRPVLIASGVKVVGEPRIVGDRKNHVQLRVTQGAASVKGIAWNMAEKLKTLAPGAVVSLAFCPSINEWNGRRDVQLEIKDVKMADDD